ncbi:MAG: D-Ala-D-Ala carboxypeptidase family metallohydrolase [Dehalococcoidia bacterium]
MNQPSANFTWEEFQSKDGAPLPEALRPNIVLLCKNLEVLRRALGDRPIQIVSGHRSPARNEAAGGVKDSQHVQAKAADIAVAGLTKLEIYCTVRRLIVEGAMHDGGLGWYDDRPTVHYDVRPGRVWYGGINNDVPLPDCGGAATLAPPPEEEDMRYLAATVDGQYMRVITNGPQARWVTNPDEDAYWVSKLGDPEAVEPGVVKALLGR